MDKDKAPRTRLPIPTAYGTLRPTQRGRADEKGPLERMREAGNHAGIVAACEGAFAAGATFWLDLQCLIAKSLALLACPHSLLVVENATSDLLARVRAAGQDLALLEFVNGVPLADAETREWLRGLSARGSSEAGSGTDSGIDEAALRTLAGAGKIGEALEQIHRAAGAARDNSIGCRIRLLGARLALDIGRPEVADPLLGGIDDFLCNTRAIDYDKAFSCELLELRIRVCDQLLKRAGAAGRTDVADRRARAVERLSLMDPARVLAISSLA